jgi:hypothetical protein
VLARDEIVGAQQMHLAIDVILSMAASVAPLCAAVFLDRRNGLRLVHAYGTIDVLDAANFKLGRSNRRFLQRNQYVFVLFERHNNGYPPIIRPCHY